MTIDPSKKISFRPGSLSGPLGEWCDKYNTTPSQAIREALSDMLGVSEPPMDGHVRTIEAVNKSRKTRGEK